MNSLVRAKRRRNCPMRDARTGRIVARVTSRPLPPAVIVRIDGIRRGDAGRFVERSGAEAHSNRRFYRRAKAKA